jgi:hypothetical protein
MGGENIPLAHYLYRSGSPVTILPAQVSGIHDGGSADWRELLQLLEAV